MNPEMRASAMLGNIHPQQMMQTGWCQPVRLPLISKYHFGSKEQASLHICSFSVKAMKPTSKDSVESPSARPYGTTAHFPLPSHSLELKWEQMRFVLSACSSTQLSEMRPAPRGPADAAQPHPARPGAAAFGSCPRTVLPRHGLQRVSPRAAGTAGTELFHRPQAGRPWRGRAAPAAIPGDAAQFASV